MIGADFPLLVGDRFGVGIILVYVWKEVPFITLLLLAALAGIGDQSEEAARTLGAISVAALPPCAVPLLFPAMLSASLIVFAFTFGAFEVPYVMGRTYPKALPVWAYERLQRCRSQPAARGAGGQRPNRAVGGNRHRRLRRALATYPREGAVAVWRVYFAASCDTPRAAARWRIGRQRSWRCGRSLAILPVVPLVIWSARFRVAVARSPAALSVERARLALRLRADDEGAPRPHDERRASRC